MNEAVKVETSKRNRKKYQVLDNTFEQFEVKRDPRQIIENTPQQQFLNKRIEDNFQGVYFNSPSPSTFRTFQNRQLPQNTIGISMFQSSKEGSPNITKLNEIAKDINSEKNIGMLSPNILQKNPSDNIQMARVSPRMNNHQSRINILIKNSNERNCEEEKLKVLRSILIDFMNTEKFQKENVIQLIDNLIIQRRVNPTENKVILSVIVYLELVRSK